MSIHDLLKYDVFWSVFEIWLKLKNTFAYQIARKLKFINYLLSAMNELSDDTKHLRWKFYLDTLLKTFLKFIDLRVPQKCKLSTISGP